MMSQSELVFMGYYSNDGLFQLIHDDKPFIQSIALHHNELFDSQSQWYT
jgi:hypothetical protein